MSDLVAFLNARLDEDEATANATDPGGTGWHVTVGEFDSGAQFNLLLADEDGRVIVSSQGRLDDEEAAHIARHDPARVLREVDAKRKIVALATLEVVDGREVDYDVREVMDDVLRTLAAVYSDHPDYQEEWA